MSDQESECVVALAVTCETGVGQVFGIEQFQQSVVGSLFSVPVGSSGRRQCISDQAPPEVFGLFGVGVLEHEVELAAADVIRRQIALDESKERLEETDIYAPISGVIIQKLVEEGQIISSGVSNVSGGTALAEIADMSRIFIIADVDETDIGDIREGQKVDVTADAFYGKIFKGKVLSIGPKGVVENSITIFKVKIEILGQGKNVLKPPK